MLIAVNPFRALPLYGAELQAAYADEGRRRGMPPHIFKLAARAFSELQLERRSQAILVSGESGAGKTETAKAVLKILSVQSAATGRAAGGSECADLLGRGLEARLVQTAPLLEAFGNCKTGRNHNSSRFGKLVVLRLAAAGTLASSEVETYLLEKTRVVSHAADERNYHIFYQLVAGAAAVQRRELGLEQSGTLRYLSPPTAGPSPLPPANTTPSRQPLTPKPAPQPLPRARHAPLSARRRAARRGDR